MSDAPQSDPTDQPREADDQEELAPTPFDGPFFLPVLLLGLAAWFGYDGWLTDDTEMLEKWWWWNRGGAVIFAASSAWTFARALRERRKS